jgi:hypothetical protein
MKAPAVVGAGMRLWGQDWIRWGLVTLLFTGISNVVIAAIDPWMATYGTYPMDDPVFAAEEPDVLAILLMLVQILLLTPWLYVILARATLHATFEDWPRPSLVGRTIRGVPSLLWIGFLLILAVIVVAIPVVLVSAILVSATPPDAEGGILALVGAAVGLTLILWIAPRLAVLVQMFVGEDRRGTQAIRGTWRRSNGAWAHVLGVVVLNALIALGISIVPSIIAGGAFPLPTAEDAVPRAILFALMSAIVTPIGVAISAALYLELSARKGTLDQTSLRRSLARFDPIEAPAIPR